ncbi:hypothetical protein DSM03_104158 [Leeuwenhoekiella aestuarii]|uniref:hypothetical protein n=1 Tax=Leeuwenhoekiella aestuarii TaxID=2249426 RepID=UPI000FFE72E9|nr:hypothetical protein [Leeuwenhoekiella aestuarii]RXG15000.1 hypothetical protein DSM03_104158 [Leeuwenhoekiella aestuarii]
MNFFKSLLVIGCLVISSSIFAQNNGIGFTSNSINKPVSSFQIPVQTKLALTLTLPEFTEALSLYNPTHNWYDTYSVTEDGYTPNTTLMSYVPQAHVLTDGFSGSDLSQALVRTQFNFFDPGFNTINPVRDSFNPYGASTIKDALLSGVLGILFN